MSSPLNTPRRHSFISRAVTSLVGDSQSSVPQKRCFVLRCTEMAANDTSYNADTVARSITSRTIAFDFYLRYDHPL
ncbi:uncharacterized protein SPSK_08218 [Sporothrix schenckii 1099-18]|uniref:Uncharacterized protein n=1 Tax=Sporothrix schenckii 1099-18 TaxID=1397361 RepID=A0A0F2MFE7_SPOSC|nr:uncharacterized protein SPSK_08218 [Sporothrix schenckii 1099-18]KJR88423.1 hypothetical protein SPSK_08218 [Sporothrix schenckii 1099-18]